jgi:DNA-binding MarR family transcriptional regulator
MDSITAAVRRNSTAAVLFHGAVAEKFGLATTDMKTMEVLDRLGPLTAGELARETGLARTSVTALIDRLERRRFVRRVRDKADRRRVIVEMDPRNAARLGSVYESLGHAAEKLFATYSDDQLHVIADFLVRGADMVFAQIGKLRK